MHWTLGIMIWLLLALRTTITSFLALYLSNGGNFRKDIHGDVFKKIRKRKKKKQTIIYFEYWSYAIGSKSYFRFSSQTFHPGMFKVPVPVEKWEPWTWWTLYGRVGLRSLYFMLIINTVYWSITKSSSLCLGCNVRIFIYSCFRDTLSLCMSVGSLRTFVRNQKACKREKMTVWYEGLNKTRRAISCYQRQWGAIFPLPGLVITSTHSYF